MGGYTHDDHIVEDVAKDEAGSVRRRSGEREERSSNTHEMTTRGRSRRLENGNLAGISILTPRMNDLTCEEQKGTENQKVEVLSASSNPQN
jgi:hypothetical protein